MGERTAREVLEDIAAWPLTEKTETSSHGVGYTAWRSKCIAQKWLNEHPATRSQSPRTMALEEAAKVVEALVDLHVPGDIETEGEARKAPTKTLRIYQEGYAVGWQDTCHRYREAIETALAAIRALASDSGHRNSVDTSALVDQSDQNLDEASK